MFGLLYGILNRGQQQQLLLLLLLLLLLPQPQLKAAEAAIRDAKRRRPLFVECTRERLFVFRMHAQKSQESTTTATQSGGGRYSQLKAAEASHFDPAFPKRAWLLPYVGVTFPCLAFQAKYAWFFPPRLRYRLCPPSFPEANA